MRAILRSVAALVLVVVAAAPEARLDRTPIKQQLIEQCAELDAGSLCAHFDQPPPGVVLDQPLESYPQYHARADAGLAPAKTDGIECVGDGDGGMRVQAVYAYSSLNRASTVVPLILSNFLPKAHAEINESAKATGGLRHVRWVTDAKCDVQVTVVQLPSSVLSGSDWPAFVNAMNATGATRRDRAYMVWADASALCGVGGIWPDDFSTAANRNQFGPTWSRVDLPCWGSAESHELMHNFGAVQRSAPNATAYFHCKDEWDRMCYADGPGSVMDFSNASGACPGPVNAAHDRRFDCNHDDYFHTSPVPGSYLATRWNAANSPYLATKAGTGLAGVGAYHGLAQPVRVVDTRTAGPRIAQNGRRQLRVVNDGSESQSFLPVPWRGTTAVVLNVTVTDPLAAGFVSLRPWTTAFSLPAVSNLNYANGQTVANLVTVPVSLNGDIEVFASTGTPHVIVDVLGWYADGSGIFSDPGSYVALPPQRIMDSRSGLGVATALGPGQMVTLKVAGSGGVPATGAGSVALNVTAVDASSASFLTLWPKGAAQPPTSNLNMQSRAAVANLALARIGADGEISIFNESGTVNVLIDVLGWFTSAADPPGGVFRSITPTRVADTRATTPLAPGETRTFTIGGVGGVAASATAVVFNLTAVAPTGGGYLSVFPTGQALPSTSSVNFLPGQTVPNLVFATLGTNSVSIYNGGDSTHVLIDVAGWFGPA